jgi:isoleucyl-tRNA synthetase
MAVAAKTVSMGRSLRTQYSLKVRQPLKALHLVTRDAEERKVLEEMQDLIREELNVKETVFRENEDQLVEYRAKANFRALGKVLGKDMKAGGALIEKLSAGQIRSLLDGGTLDLDVGGRSFTLTKDGVEVQRIEKENLKVINDGSLTIALDPELTPELIREGLARDMVRGIQNLRKEMGLEVSDRIRLTVSGDGDLERTVAAFRDHIMAETLAVECVWGRGEDGHTIECGDGTCTVSLRKA